MKITITIDTPNDVPTQILAFVDGYLQKHLHYLVEENVTGWARSKEDPTTVLQLSV